MKNLIPSSGVVPADKEVEQWQTTRVKAGEGNQYAQLRECEDNCPVSTNDAEWTGEVPARLHKPCNEGSIPSSATKALKNLGKHLYLCNGYILKLQ